MITVDSLVKPGLFPYIFSYLDNYVSTFQVKIEASSL